MPTYDPHYNPIQPDDEAFNRRMAEIEERRRARGTMPTTVVGPTGASPGKDMAGRPLVPPTPAPVQPAAPAKTGDTFGDFRAQQQAENRRRIAEGYQQDAQASADEIRAANLKQKQERDALRRRQNGAAFALWRALDGTKEGNEVLDGSADLFMRLGNEQFGQSGTTITGYKKIMRDSVNGNEPALRFLIKDKDGNERFKEYGRSELMEGLLRHGVPKEAFADRPAPKEEAKAAPADFNKDFFGSLNPAGKAAYANGKRDGFTEADFTQEPPAKPTTEKPDPAEVKRQEAWTAAYNEHFARILKNDNNSGLTPEQVKAEATKWANAQVGVSAASASAQPTDAPAAIADALDAADRRDEPDTSARNGAPAANGKPNEQEDEWRGHGAGGSFDDPYPWLTKSGGLMGRTPPRQNQPKPNEASAKNPSQPEEQKPIGKNHGHGVYRVAEDTGDLVAKDRANTARIKKDQEARKKFGNTQVELENNLREIVFRDRDRGDELNQEYVNNAASSWTLPGVTKEGVQNRFLDSARSNNNTELLQAVTENGKEIPGVKKIVLPKTPYRTGVHNGKVIKWVSKTPNGTKERDAILELIGPALSKKYGNKLVDGTIQPWGESEDDYTFYVDEAAFKKLNKTLRDKFMQEP